MDLEQNSNQEYRMKKMEGTNLPEQHFSRFPKDFPGYPSSFRGQLHITRRKEREEGKEEKQDEIQQDKIQEDYIKRHVISLLLERQEEESGKWMERGGEW